MDSILDYARYDIQYYHMSMRAVARHAVDRLVILMYQVDDIIILVVNPRAKLSPETM